MDKILIIYSNPSDTDRLRLDKEHRAIDDVIENLKLPNDTILRRHAATLEDVVKALAESDYSIVQFSGHGSDQGFCLESDESSSELVTAQRITGLLSASQPNLKIAIFMSCFSAGALPELIKSAPYLMTVFGPANDVASIEFIRMFYTAYFKRDSIEFACDFAQKLVGDDLTVILSRRALESKGTVLLQVFPNASFHGDALLVDLSEADTDIDALGISREAFLHSLTRKIRLHRWIFDHPRDRAVLPIGQFIGVFSWQNAKDIIRCHRILRMKSEIDDKTCEVWADLAVAYNDSAMSRYRWAPSYAINDAQVLGLALKDYQFDLKYLTNHQDVIEVLNLYVPEQFRLSKSLMAANLKIVQRKLDSGDFGSAVAYLETALSSFHDLLDSLTEALALNTQAKALTSNT